MTSPPVTERSLEDQRRHVLKVAGVMAMVLMLATLIAWAMWRHGKWFGEENGAPFEFWPTKAADTKHAGAAAGSNAGAALPSPGTLPDPDAATTPNLPSTALKKPRPAIRMPLARPVPETDTAAVAPAQRHRRHHRGFLGLGKLWHWIRRDHRKTQE